MSDELKRCPFCGGPANYISVSTGYRIECGHCSAWMGGSREGHEGDNDAGLLARLLDEWRGPGGVPEVANMRHAMKDAAAAITRLTAELAEARAEQDNERMINDCHCVNVEALTNERYTAESRLAAAESALLKLANAAAVVGGAYFGTDTLEPPVQALYDATIAALAAIRALPAAKPGEPEGDGK